MRWLALFLYSDSLSIFAVTNCEFVVVVTRFSFDIFENLNLNNKINTLTAAAAAVAYAVAACTTAFPLNEPLFCIPLCTQHAIVIRLVHLVKHAIIHQANVHAKTV